MCRCGQLTFLLCLLLAAQTPATVNGLDLQAATPRRGVYTRERTGAPVTLLWQEEFIPCNASQPGCLNGLDGSSWGVDLGDGRDYGTTLGWGNGELQCYVSTPDVINVQPKTDNPTDGVLVIAPNVRPRNVCKNPMTHRVSRRDYVSARVHTWNKKSFRWAGDMRSSDTISIQARLRLPFGQGMFPGLWLLPQNTTDCKSVGCGMYGPWCRSGEIPIIEAVNTMVKGLSSLIIDGHVNELTGEKCKRSYGVLWRNTSRGLADDLHTYTFTWNATHMRWYFNGIMWHQSTYLDWANVSVPGNPAAPYDQPFYLIMNVAIGGGWSGPPDQTTVWPQAMSLDSVKVHAMECQASETDCSDGVDNDCNGLIDMKDAACSGDAAAQEMPQTETGVASPVGIGELLRSIQSGVPMMMGTNGTRGAANSKGVALRAPARWRGVVAGAAAALVTALAWL